MRVTTRVFRAGNEYCFYLCRNRKKVCVLRSIDGRVARSGRTVVERHESRRDTLARHGRDLAGAIDQSRAIHKKSALDAAQGLTVSTDAHLQPRATRS